MHRKTSIHSTLFRPLDSNNQCLCGQHALWTMPICLTHKGIIEHTQKFEKDKAVIRLSHTLSLPRQRSQAEIRSVLCSLSFSYFTWAQDTPGSALSRFLTKLGMCSKLTLVWPATRIRDWFWNTLLYFFFHLSLPDSTDSLNSLHYLPAT